MRRSIIKYNSLILIVILLIFILPLQAEQDINVKFEDSGLEEAVREAIKKPSGNILASELIKLKQLDAKQRDITSLKGIEYCSSLVELNLSRNKITNISALADLTALQWLDLSGNQISDISPLAGLSSLQWLSLHFNNIKDISPLNNLGFLKGVVIEGNPLNAEAKSTVIPELEKRGVRVKY
jgi:internalin A